MLHCSPLTGTQGLKLGQDPHAHEIRLAVILPLAVGSACEDCAEPNRQAGGTRSPQTSLSLDPKLHVLQPTPGIL